MKGDAQIVNQYRLTGGKTRIMEGFNQSLSSFLRRSFFFTLIALLSATVSLWAQSYGLRFVGQEEMQDNRTSLDLAPEKPLCLDGNIELSFDVSLASSYKTYFGYIFRMIQDDAQNLDLLYDQKSLNFKMIIGERFSQSVIKIDSAHLYHHWNRFKLQLDLKSQAMHVYVNDRLVITDKIHFKERGCFKLFFGGNEFNRFKSKDVPPMNLKDIILSENDEPVYHWPLNEVGGTTAKDEISGRVASVKNPVWIKSLHNEWKLTDQLSLKGRTSVAFDPKSETVYVIGSNALYQYAVRKRQGSVQLHKNPPQSFFLGSQAIYNPYTARLYDYFVDQKAVSVYDPVLRGWATETITPSHVKVTEFWHANQFIGADSSLYILGGYGQLTYKNRIHRYRFATKQWETVPITGNVYTPRYLAALGTNSSADTAYLIGGYGSLTGEQMLNPKSNYDLLEYRMKDNTFRKIYELNVPKTDFAFANSLVIDPKAKVFYGLIFPNQQFKSQLQLIRGSLSEPTYELVGHSIPYQFHDIHSYSDLYYCPVSQKLIAVVLYRNEPNNTTDVKLYSISFPPNALETRAVPEQQSSVQYGLFGLAVFGAGVLFFLYFRKKRRTSARQKAEVAGRLLEPEPLPTAEKLPVNSVSGTEPTPRASIFFFGNFQVIDHDGCDITKSFTPLLKELFLLLALNSIDKQRGVPSEKLNEILWPDKSGRDASNNRSVNIAKLRNILDKVGFCSLSKESGYWKMEFDFSQLYVDYERYMAIIHHKAALTRQTIFELGEITKRGSFLLNTEYYWLDDFKADSSNKIINTFLQYAEKLDISEDPEFLIELTNFIFYYDPVNEDAIILKCKALSLMGKHTLAKNTFEKFTRDYKAIYGEEYEQPFSAIID
ncbi:Kelch repeat-containing protein [Larkinella terrae]|uniref:Galactose oxidase n=1 Tax=Larkinella terrae TaxID=2025311 RepID=A0A7K0EPE1_9BACT|nr:galactose oxidase [Larkinella terrae]MRS63654.1 galactose oxidase [Larkinella terrae]